METLRFYSTSLLLQLCTVARREPKERLKKLIIQQKKIAKINSVADNQAPSQQTHSMEHTQLRTQLGMFVHCIRTTDEILLVQNILSTIVEGCYARLLQVEIGPNKSYFVTETGYYVRK